MGQTRVTNVRVEWMGCGRSLQGRLSCLCIIPDALQLFYVLCLLLRQDLIAQRGALVCAHTKEITPLRTVGGHHVPRQRHGWQYTQYGA